MIISVKDAGVVQLEKLNDESQEGFMNGSQLKIYRDDRSSMHNLGSVL